MDNINEVLKKAKAKLDEKLSELEVLEADKKDILIRYEKVNKEERELIEKEMKESEEKFKSLSEEVLIFAEKVKELKKRYY
jgi:hypothetical protein